MGCSTNLNKLHRSMHNLEQIAKAGWVPQLAQRVAAGGMKLVADGFRKQQDPWGKAWAPLARQRQRDIKAAARKMKKWNQQSWFKRRFGKGPEIKGSKILIDTGRMRASTGANAIGSTARVVIPTWYASVHQHGAHITPRTTLGIAHYARGKSKTAGSRKLTGFHNRTLTNGITIPARKMLPDDSAPMPNTWRAMTAKESTLLVQQRLREVFR